MERKNLIIGLSIGVAVLAIAVIITSVGWSKSHKELTNYRNGDGQLVELNDSLELCDDPKTLDQQVACVERLAELSKLLAQYEQKLKSIKVQ